MDLYVIVNISLNRMHLESKIISVNAEIENVLLWIDFYFSYAIEKHSRSDVF